MARSVYEIKAQKTLESQGWKVDNKAGMGRWSKNRDFFNLFDLVAVRAGDPVRWIAIKGHNGGYSELRKLIKQFFLPEGNSKELWRFTKGLRYPPKIEYIE